MLSKSGDPRFEKMSFVVNMFVEQALEEISDRKEATDLEMYFAQIGLLCEWISHGRNDFLPPSLRALAEEIFPTVQLESVETPKEIDA